MQSLEHLTILKTSFSSVKKTIFAHNVIENSYNCTKFCVLCNLKSQPQDL